MTKWIVLGVVALLALVGVGVWELFRITAPVADTATHFVVTAGTGGPQAAYAETSAGLRTAMPEPQFEAKLKSLHLTEARSASWYTRKVSSAVGVVAGTVRLASGDTEPLTIHLVKLNGKWLVSNFYYGTRLDGD